MPTPSTEKSSRVLLFVMLAIIVASINAFLVLRPSPSGAGGASTTNPAAAKK
ncbi:hypothetical protein [Granulicella sibirica]|uniref:Uncharacterized protein n=1 Tax=Granulicella sibirica TaxID=2479048 RepID=A0A4Q0T170_9BACT|nr:hypothetical protein [Granulicella sibirica]RXH57365.1 hypothetical protein GRAN_0675 [Granulicella sibirica]